VQLVDERPQRPLVARTLARDQLPALLPGGERLFLATARLSADAAEYFRLPRERTVIMGSRIEL
jgi:KUP system potassium uptake protein